MGTFYVISTVNVLSGLNKGYTEIRLFELSNENLLRGPLN